jgi:hypothetical protein
LEYSIRKNTNSSVEIVALHELGIDYPEPSDMVNRQRTPFSFQRFLIPEISDYKGKAIYLDSDMQVFSDIKQLWTLPIGNNSLLAASPKKGEGRKPHFSVMLIDCEKNKWSINDIISDLNAGKYSYSDLMDNLIISDQISSDIPSSWNSLEFYKEKETDLIHYTDMKTQPWVSTKNPYESLWVKDLISAIKDGYITLEYLKEHVDNGWVRPSLYDQVLYGISDSKFLPKESRKKDLLFLPPYNELVCDNSSVSISRFKCFFVKIRKLSRYAKRFCLNVF